MLCGNSGFYGCGSLAVGNLCKHKDARGPAPVDTVPCGAADPDQCGRGHGDHSEYDRLSCASASAHHYDGFHHRVPDAGLPAVRICSGGLTPCTTGDKDVWTSCWACCCSRAWFLRSTWLFCRRPGKRPWGMCKGSSTSTFRPVLRD